MFLNKHKNWSKGSRSLLFQKGDYNMKKFDSISGQKLCLPEFKPVGMIFDEGSAR